ncbi:hypothetical protein GS584_10205 [Rhodococcus hoagii]|nr:hypothetical protein [Prescottella equi]
MGITGSTLPASSSWWLSENVGEHVPVCPSAAVRTSWSAFVGGTRITAVGRGSCRPPYLCAPLDAFDESVVGRVRERRGRNRDHPPAPSMPVRFWNDPDGARYRASYFETFPGVWRHGDWISITDRGGVAMHGRSDSTSIATASRMGSADIYQAVERLPEVVGALVIGAERSDGGYWMPLFVVLADGCELDDALRERIRTEIREKASPRHVPDESSLLRAFPIPAHGKKLEVPLKRLFQGGAAARVVDRSAVDDPALLDWFARFRISLTCEITHR